MRALGPRCGECEWFGFIIRAAAKKIDNVERRLLVSNQLDYLRLGKSDLSPLRNSLYHVHEASQSCCRRARHSYWMRHAMHNHLATLLTALVRFAFTFHFRVSVSV